MDMIQMSRASTPVPSEQLQELLERLGILSQQRDELVQRVNELEASSKLSVSTNVFLLCYLRCDCSDVFFLDWSRSRFLGSHLA